MAVFNVLNSKVIYYDAPKCGSTTVLAYVNMINNPELLHEVQKLISEGVEPVAAYDRCWQADRQKYSRNTISSKTVITKTTPVPSDAIKFCIVRDPIQRFISVYKALILSKTYVASNDKSVDAFIKIIDVDKTTLTDWTEVSPVGWRNVKFHFLPLVTFYGKDPKIFTHIFNMSQIDEVRKLLENAYNVSLPSLKLNFTRKMDISLTPEQIEWVKIRYARDYRFYRKWMEKE